MTRAEHRRAALYVFLLGMAAILLSWVWRSV